MEKLWFIIASVDDGAFEAIKKRIKKFGKSISDYQISKTFKVCGHKLHSFTLVCDEKKKKKIRDCGYETHSMDFKD